MFTSVLRSASLIVAVVATGGLAACGGGGGDDVATVAQAESVVSGVQAPSEASRSLNYEFASDGERMVVAASAAWDQGVETSWVGLYEPGDSEIEMLPPPPLSAPFANAAVQVVGGQIFLIGTECPKPPDEELTCGAGARRFALTSSVDSIAWESIPMPELPEDTIYGVGPINGAAAFGALPLGGVMNGAQSSVTVFDARAGKWTALPTSPVTDAGTMCSVNGMLTVIESPISAGGLVPDPSMSFEEREAMIEEFSKSADSEVGVATYDAERGTWSETSMGSNSGAGHVECSQGGITMVRDTNNLEVFEPATGTKFVVQSDGPVWESATAATLDGETTVIYATSEPTDSLNLSRTNGTTESVRSTAGESVVSSPVRLAVAGTPAYAFSAAKSSYWVEVADGRIGVHEIER